MERNLIMKKVVSLLLVLCMTAVLAISAGAAYIVIGGEKLYWKDNGKVIEFDQRLPKKSALEVFPKYEIANNVFGEGETTVSAARAVSGDVITVTTAPADQYELVIVDVIDALGNPVEVRLGENENEYTFVMPAVRATVATGYAPVATTRAEVVVSLWKMAGEPVVNYAMTFEDVNEDADYAEAIRWAASEGIVLGYSETTFAPDDGMTREQFAAVLYRYAEKQDEGFVGAWVFLLPYEDRAEISEYADAAVHWAAMKGIVAADENGFLYPAAPLDVVQAASMLEAFEAALAE